MTEKYFFFGFGQVAKYYIDHLIKKKKNLALVPPQHQKHH